LLFIGAKLHVSGTRLKNPDKIACSGGGMHNRNSHNRTCIAVMPKRYRKGGTWIKRKTGRVSNQILGTSIETEGCIGCSKAISSCYSAIIC